MTTGTTTPTFAVLAPGADPATDSALYTSQPMHEGLNYITMRDGIQLAATVRYPYGSTCSSTAPCPTVIEYSGYATAGPTDPIPTLLSSALGSPCTGCGDPNLLPDGATDVGAVLARVAGLRHGEPADAGDGLLGWRLRPLRLSVRLRRLRRRRDRGPPGLGGQPQGRDGRHQLLRPVRAALGGHRPSGPGSHRPDEPDGRPVLDRLPRRHLQQRVRRQLGGGPGRRRHAGGDASAVARWCPFRRRRSPNVGQPWVYYEMAAEGAGLHVPGQPGPPRPVREPLVARGAPAGRRRAPVPGATPRCSTVGR